MEDDATYPVKVLREHATALEAALSVCLADPSHKPVHRLRTETRRLEAQVLLLAQVPGMPEHGKQATRLLRALRKLRRSAGAVRDLDVQRKHLEELAATAEETTVVTKAAESTNGSGPATAKGVRKRSGKTLRTGEAVAAAEGDEPVQRALGDGAADLRDHLHRKRMEAAAELQKLLKKHQTKAASAVEALLKTLGAAEDVTLPAAELLRHAEGVFTREGVLAGGDVQALTEDQLHDLRKAAKAARYLAETVPESATAAAAAAHFEDLQEAGGQWHDALDLARAARRHLGKSHELTVALAAERDRKLASYREALAAETKAESKAEAPAKAKKPKRRQATKKAVWRTARKA